MKKTPYKMIYQRFEFVRDERRKYEPRSVKKSRDRLKFNHQRPSQPLEKQQEIVRCILQAKRSGSEVRVLLFGYFQNQQVIGQIVDYEKEMEIVRIVTDDRAEWIDVQDIIELEMLE